MKKDKIKICFISLKAYQLFNQKVESTFGGAEVQMAFLSEALAKNIDFEVNLVVGNYGQPKIEERKGVKLLLFKDSYRKGFLRKITDLLEFLFLLKKIDSDIYVTTTANPVVGVVSFFCKLRDKKHIHRTASDEGVNGKFISKSGIEGLLYKYGLEKADLVVVQNSQHLELLKKNHGIEAKILRNSFEFFANDVLPFEKRKHVLWVSRCHEVKRPELFLDLAEKFPGEKFLMICPPSEGRESLFNTTKNRAQKIENVEFVEFVPFDKIQKYYNQAKVFVCTSDFEGFPNTFVQSGIGATPILSLNVNPDNMITVFGCGFFSEGDFEKMIKQLQCLLEKRQVWEEKGKGVSCYILKTNDINKNIKILENLIKSVTRFQ